MRLLARELDSSGTGSRALARGRGRAAVGELAISRPTPKLRVVVLTAEVGEGHVAAARALAAELESERPEVEVLLCDALVGLGPLLRFILLDLYRWQLHHAPAASAYGPLYRLFERFRPARGLGRAGLILFGARLLLRLVREHEPDVVVSTYPAATSVLGYLRRRGRIAVPVYATVTDLAGVSFWAHAGIDLHLVMHESCVRAVERVAGAGSARCVRPLVAAAFLEPCSREEARRVLELPREGPIAIVSGGGWGVGDLEGATRAALDIPELTVVCLAGRDRVARSRLEAVFAAEVRVRVLGFTSQMNDLLAAADVVVHSTGGITALEAIARDRPLVAYGAPPGHARLIASAMASVGLAGKADSRAELTTALRSALTRPRLASPKPSTLSSAAELVVAARARVRPVTPHSRGRGTARRSTMQELGPLSSARAASIGLDK